MRSVSRQCPQLTHEQFTDEMVSHNQGSNLNSGGCAKRARPSLRPYTTQVPLLRARVRLLCIQSCIIVQLLPLRAWKPFHCRPLTLRKCTVHVADQSLRKLQRRGQPAVVWVFLGRGQVEPNEAERSARIYRHFQHP